jgi:hypothetical protein
MLFPEARSSYETAGVSRRSLQFGSMAAYGRSAAGRPYTSRCRPDCRRRNRSGDAGEAVGLTQGLERLGWKDGRNIQVDYRFAEGRSDRFQSLAKELIALHQT